MSRPHGSAGWLSPSARLRLTRSIREARAADPAATVRQLAARTGASAHFVAGVLRLLRDRDECSRASGEAR